MSKTICDNAINILFRNTIQHILSYPLKHSSWLLTASNCAFSLLKKQSFQVRYLLHSRKLNVHQVSNLSVQVSLMLKLIVQATLAIIYLMFFNSVVSLYLTSQPALVANTWINKLLFTDKRTRKNYISFQLHSKYMFEVCFKVFRM